MEKIINKIGAGLDIVCATMMMAAMLPFSKNFPMLSVFFFLGSIILWNDILREDKEGGAR